jgi:hypothetical protein
MTAHDSFSFCGPARHAQRLPSTQHSEFKRYHANS